MSPEEKFYGKLQEIFVGAKVEGQGGFINLMKLKSNYYNCIKDRLQEEVDNVLKEFPDFRDELFDKLYSFFNRYFMQNGSIAFNDTAIHNNIYEKVYTDEKDVVLFWKTQMLYYVKTDSLYNSLPVEFDGVQFYFDCEKLEHKKSHEKKSLIFSFKEIKDDMIHLWVEKSNSGSETNADVLLKAILKETESINITEEHLQQAFRVFNRQSEVDYFINKNAKEFLQEQFKLWSYQYFWGGADKWGAHRISQLQILRKIAFKLIDFVAQFENELVKIWNKPKFVKNSNYVITLDRLNLKLIDKIKKSEGYKEQLKEWQELGIDKNNPKAPIDTKYFKELELDILALFDDLDEALDGWLIKSENYQALNTILPKFKEKVQCIYIDPPFNTGADFEYIDKFRNGSWLSLMKDRIDFAIPFLKDDGCFWLHLDENSNTRGKELLKNNFSDITEIIFDTNATKDPDADLYGYKSFGDNFQLKHQTIFYCRNKKYLFRKLWHPNRRETQLGIGWLDLISFENGTGARGVKGLNFKIEKWDDDKLELFNVQIEEKIFPVGDIWSDIFSFTQSEMRVSESFGFTASQKSENLLRRIIQSTSDQKDIVFDYFLGIGTTCAVAHKLNRKWLGVEVGKHFEETFTGKDGNTLLGIKGRMKWVLCGDQRMKAIDKDRRPHLSKDLNWQGGGFFKYYELEQYEETLANTKYSDGDLFTQTKKSDYEQYVFLPDEKMLNAVEIDYENNKAKVDLSKLYENIDIAETLSNLTGKWIKSITANEVTFANGSIANLRDPDYKLIKPLIWWESK